MTEHHPAVAYLERALAESERWATAASDGSGHWLINPRYADHRTVVEYVIQSDGGYVVHVDTEEHDTEAHRAEALLIQSNNPRAVLRRVASDRRILAEHASDGGWQGGYCVRCADTHPDDCDCGMFNGAHARQYQDWPCATVLRLAAGWGWEAGT